MHAPKENARVRTDLCVQWTTRNLAILGLYTNAKLTVIAILGQSGISESAIVEETAPETGNSAETHCHAPRSISVMRILNALLIP